MRQEAKDIAIMLGINIEHHATNVMLDAFYGLAHEQGRQQGMKQERALWEIAKLSQEIEDNEPDYSCPSCKTGSVMLVGNGNYFRCDICDYYRKVEREEP